MLHYNPQHISSSTLLIFRRTNCIITASGIVTLCKRPYLVYAGYWVVLVDRVYNCSVSPYGDGYLLYLQCKLQFYNDNTPTISYFSVLVKCSEVMQCNDGTSNKVSNIIIRLIDNRKLLLICILLLLHSLIFLGFFFIKIWL